MPIRLTVAVSDEALSVLPTIEGAVAAFWAPGDEAPTLSPAAAALDETTGGQVLRALSKAKGERGEATLIAAPHGMAADALVLIGLGADPLDAVAAKRLGGAIAKTLSAQKLEALHLRLEGLADADIPARAADLALGLRLRAYVFDEHKSEKREEEAPTVTLAGVAPDPDALAAGAALAEGVALSRDLVNEPANVLTPPEFAKRIEALGKKKAHPDLEIEILKEKDLEKLGMGALLGVGRGSRKESSVAIMRWTGAKDPEAAPLCLVGKGVCFDTGGISLKPAGGMEEMTMDMGGAAAVVGAMKALAGRKAPVNVVGVVGLVENMPDGDAQRPGDVVTSMAGKTIEVINTDAEGRLVLADVMHYAQERFEPRAMVDLATLTGAIIIALGHEHAGFFANDDAFADALSAAAKTEGEPLWRMPLGEAYDKALKSRIADMKNVGGRPAGSITAAQFLQRFVKEGQAWAHIDIAGVCLPKEDDALWPKGPSGWGVATLVRLAEDMFEA